MLILISLEIKLGTNIIEVAIIIAEKVIFRVGFSTL
jgi:hypothetical protein